MTHSLITVPYWRYPEPSQPHIVILSGAKRSRRNSNCKEKELRDKLSTIGLFGSKRCSDKLSMTPH